MALAGIMNYAGYLTIVVIIGTCGFSTGLPADLHFPDDISQSFPESPEPHNIPDFSSFIKNLPDLSDLGRLPDPCEKNIPDFLTCPVDDIRAAVQHKSQTFGTAITCNCNKNKALVVTMSCDRNSGNWKYISDTTCDSSPWDIRITMGTIMLIIALVISLKLNLVFCIALRRSRDQKILRVVNIQLPRPMRNSTNPPPYEQMT